MEGGTVSVTMKNGEPHFDVKKVAKRAPKASKVENVAVEV